LASTFGRSVASDAALGALLPPSPEDELLVTPHISGDVGPISALHCTVRPSGYPVRWYRRAKVALLPLERCTSRRDNATGRLLG
jgi:hypothetical protein